MCGLPGALEVLKSEKSPIAWSRLGEKATPPECIQEA